MKNIVTTMIALFLVSFFVHAQLPDPVIWLKLNEAENNFDIQNSGTETTVQATIMAPGGIVTPGSIVPGQADDEKGTVCYFNSNNTDKGGLELRYSDGSRYSGPQGGAARTYSYWIKFENLAFTTSFWSAAGDAAGFTIQIEGGGKIRLLDGGGNIIYADLFEEADAGKWKHVTFVAPQNAGLQDVKIYKNGVEATNYSFAGSNAPINTVNNIIQLFPNFTGWVSDFRYYDVAFTDAQVVELYNDVTATVNMSTDGNTGSEADQSVITITATASAPVSGNQTVDIDVAGTVTSDDYTLSDTQITIADGETSGTATLTIVDDSDFEEIETATVTILNPSDGIILGSPVSSEIVIIDNESTNVELSLSANSGTEVEVTEITLTATASEAVAGNQTVDITISGSATSDDYTLSATQITIADGQTTGTATLTIVDDSDYEQTETVTITLVNPSSGIVLGANVSTVLEIISDDAQPVAPKLAVCFRDNMVLQRNKDVAIFGESDTGNEITVTFNGQTKTTTAANGKWKLYLDPMTANAEGQSLSVEFQDGQTLIKTITLNDILIGDIYLAGGQSNMLGQLGHYLEEGEEIINNPLIRFYDFPLLREYDAEPNNGWPQSWTKVENASHARQYSATAYYFAKNLQPQVGVPIGIIKSAVGATAVETWMSEATLLSDPETAPIMERKYSPDVTDYQEPTINYDQMITPLLPFTLSGVIWYQGESNSHNRIGGPAQYYKLFTSMITQWRSDFENESLPFFYVQLPGFGGFTEGSESFGNDDNWSRIREAQLMALELENTGMAVAIDLGEKHEIHPHTKHEVGRRLSLLAREHVYGEEIESSGPLYSDYMIEDDKIIVSFDHTGPGLALLHGTELVGFEIASTDKNFIEANAEIVGNTVELTGIENPVYVRYAWKNWPVYNSVMVNLCNSEGLPASPFRSLKDAVELVLKVNVGSEADTTIITLYATTWSAPVSGDQTVDVAVSGEGITSSDYILSDTQITIADGENTGSVTLTIVDDTDTEGEETATVVISNPSSGLVLGVDKTADIVIEDNEVNAINYFPAENENRISFPTVTNGILNFSTEVDKVRIVNTLGATVKMVNNTNMNNIDVSELKSGMYIIGFNDEKVEKFFRR